MARARHRSRYRQRCSALNGNGTLNVVDHSGSGLGSLLFQSGSTLAPGSLSSAGTITINQLVTASGANLAFNLLPSAPGNTDGDLLYVTDPNGLNGIAAGTNVVFGTSPTVPGDYELIGGNTSGFNAANFVLPAVPDGARQARPIRWP